MTIQLGTTNSEPNRINKNVSIRKTFSATLKQPTSIMQPAFVLNGSVGDFAKFNYCYVPDFQRYYYIRNIVSVSADLFQVECEVDVLYTYRKRIMQLQGVVQRSTDQYNAYLPDGIIKTYCNPTIVTKKFPNGFTDESLLLAVVG